MNVGNRVKVCIQNRDRYASGAADALDGKLGTIDKIDEGGNVLVRFDEPAPKWWTYQTPAHAFWFGREEVRVLS